MRDHYTTNKRVSFIGRSMILSAILYRHFIEILLAQIMNFPVGAGQDLGTDTPRYRGENGRLHTWES